MNSAHGLDIFAGGEMNSAHGLDIFAGGEMNSAHGLDIFAGGEPNSVHVLNKGENLKKCGKYPLMIEAKHKAYQGFQGFSNISPKSAP